MVENQEKEHVHVNWDNATPNSMAQHFEDNATPNSMAQHFEDNGTPNSMAQHFEDWAMNASSADGVSRTLILGQTNMPAAKKRRQRRSGERKNEKEIEDQRMTHIAVERNRRKQMNEYLSVLRGLMPQSYSQKGDQASIIGGAINYVKELEQQVHFLSGQKGIHEKHEKGSSSSQPFEEFFIFPQYSTTTIEATAATVEVDVEVTMVDNNVNLKIRSKKRLKKLAKMVLELESLKLKVLHLNVTTVDFIALYSLSLKVEHDCTVRSSEDVAAAVNYMLQTFGG